MAHYKKCKTFQKGLPLCRLPMDLLKIIISLYPCPQWFRLCKQLNTLAKQITSPLDYRKQFGGALQWAMEGEKIHAVTFLLQDPRVNVYPTTFQWAIIHRRKEVVQLMLKCPRVDPSAQNNAALRLAISSDKEIAELLLQGKLSVLEIEL
jgi:hypothetical protein